MEDDKSTIKFIKQGNEAALAKLYDQNVKQIYNYHFYRTLHKQTAEDLTSQTFMKLLENIKKFDANKASITTWMYTIARNTLYDYFRTNKAEADINDMWHLSFENNNDVMLDVKKNLQEVEKYLDKLEPEQREVILLRVWDGLSYKEIAQIVKKSEAACKMTFSRALGKLRKELPSALALMVLVKYFI